LIIFLSRTLIFRKSNQLFKSFAIEIQEELSGEHDAIELLRNHGLWKDSCIKMGGILEFILTDWMIKKALPNYNLKFENKLGYILKELKSKDLGIGTFTQWGIVHSVIREYRNFVHLQEYYKLPHKLNKSDFDTLYPVYLELIKNF